MKNLINLFFILIPLFVLNTCEKDKDKETACRVTAMTFTQDDEIYSFLYSYDDEGRLVKSDFGDGWYSTYQYESNKVTEENYYADTLSFTNVYTLTYDGYVMLSTSTPAGSNDPESSTTYDFDEDGYLISMVEVNESDDDDIEETTNEYQDGNLVYKEVEHSPDVYY